MVGKNWKKQKNNWFSQLLLIVFLVGLWRLFDRRLRTRLPSPEGIDDPDIASAFEWVTNMPYMRWMRSYVSMHSLQTIDYGEAIDLGCGAGQLVIDLAKNAPHMHVTGIDLSEKLLADAQQSAQQAGVAGRVEFRQGNAEEIPFHDQSIDLVISTFPCITGWSQSRCSMRLTASSNPAVHIIFSIYGVTWHSHFTC